MISHLTGPRRELNFEMRVNKHYGEFKYWPQVWNLWHRQTFGTDVSNVNLQVWKKPPGEKVLNYYCSRRR